MRPLLFVLLWPAVLFGVSPSITIPDRIKGEPGAFVRVTATTDGKNVRWIALTPGLAVFPADLLRDSRTTVVVALRPGAYRLLALTAVGDELSEPAECVVEIAGDPPPPGPEPPTPPTPPADPLAEALARLYAADTATSKAEYARALAGFYRQAARSVDARELRTAGELYQVLRRASARWCPTTPCRHCAARIADELRRAADARRRPAHRRPPRCARALFLRLAALLETLR
ncbi:MAG: hypothetical protein U0736_19400 [Gemmataceae bacterium]